jgi:hypothetical protein
VFLLLGNASAFFGLAIREFQWFDEKDVWFPEDFLGFPDRLRRYHLIAMYRVTTSHDTVNKRNATALSAAQIFLFTGGALLSVLLLAIVWSAVRPV